MFIDQEALLNSILDLEWSFSLLHCLDIVLSSFDGDAVKSGIVRRLHGGALYGASYIGGL